MTEAPTMSPYLTVVSDRSPRQKAHESLGQAKKAITFRAKHPGGTPPHCAVYKWNDAKGWDKLWDIPTGTRPEKLPWN